MPRQAGKENKRSRRTVKTVMNRILTPTVYFVLALVVGFFALLASEGTNSVKDVGFPVVLGAISAALFVGAAILQSGE